MSKASVFIVEDNPLQAQGLTLQLLQAGYKIAGLAGSAEQAVPQILSDPPDILLLDIELEGKKDGVTLAQEVNHHLSYSLPTIFTSRLTDDKTLKRAAKTSPVSYLSKPFNFLELSIALETTLKLKAQSNASAPSEAKEPYLLNDSIFIKSDNAFNRIPVTNTLFIEAQRQYSAIYTTEKRYVISQNIEMIAKKFDHPDIARVHRSFIINLQNIDRISGKLIHLKETGAIPLPSSIKKLGNRIPIGDKYKNGILNKLRSI